MARENNLDLVEVAAVSDPPVCRLLDYGKYKFEQAKKDREARKSQKIPILREIRVRPKIDGHDLEAKTRLVMRLLGEGDKVKISVIFRGREIVHPEIGRNLLRRISTSLGEMAVVEGAPMAEGRNLNMILAPTAVKPVKRESEDAKT